MKRDNVKKIFIILYSILIIPVFLFGRENSSNSPISPNKTGSGRIDPENTLSMDDDFINRVSQNIEGIDKKWFCRLSGTVNYMTLGPQVREAFNQMQGMFSSELVELSVINFNTSFKASSASKIERTETHFLPTGNIGFGMIRKNHRFGFDIGFAGMVTLNTIDENTTMTLSEETRGDIDPRPMANLGFVDPETGLGLYDLTVVMNEQIWIMTSSIYYDYALLKYAWGDFSLGTGLGLIMISMRQAIEFSFVRTDIDQDSYSERKIDGYVQSTGVNDIGPILRLYCGYRNNIAGLFSIEILAGVTYGYVDIDRRVDGSGTVHLGGERLPISFPITSVSIGGKRFESNEKTRLETTGIFIQAGVLL